MHEVCILIFVLDNVKSNLTVDVSEHRKDVAGLYMKSPEEYLASAIGVLRSVICCRCTPAVPGSFGEDGWRSSKITTLYARWSTVRQETLSKTPEKQTLFPFSFPLVLSRRAPEFLFLFESLVIVVTELEVFAPRRVCDLFGGITSADCVWQPRFRLSSTMSKSGQPPDLKKYMDKKLNIKLNAGRNVVGVLRGFDQFMNLVLDNTLEINGADKNEIGMVVIRGNSVVMIEALEPVRT